MSGVSMCVDREWRYQPVSMSLQYGTPVHHTRSPKDHPVRKIHLTQMTSASEVSRRPMCFSCKRQAAVVILGGHGYCGACAVRLFDPPYQSGRPRQKLAISDLLKGHH